MPTSHTLGCNIFRIPTLWWNDAAIVVNIEFCRYPACFDPECLPVWLKRSTGSYPDWLLRYLLACAAQELVSGTTILVVVGWMY